MLPRLLLGFPLLIAPGLLVAASAPVRAVPEPFSAQLARANAEAQAAEAEMQRLEEAAEQARDEAGKVQARQAAAAEAIAAAEARISAAEARIRVIAAELAARREKLVRQQAPAGALLAGLAMMSSRPPMLAILDEGSIDEFVRVRILLDSTLPVIRRRTAALSAEVDRAQLLQSNAEAARTALVRERRVLEERREAFASLEAQALRLAEQRGGEALGAGDVALSLGEEAARISEQERRGRAAAVIAAELAALPAAPSRPVPALSEQERPELLYRMPVEAPVVEGFGSVSPAGVRSRGIALATARGAPVHAPADGIVRFSGPFRNHDGIVIIDHGQGWMSLIMNVASPIEPGRRVQIGQPLGRALGRIGVELSHNGRRMSPALIAGSSQKLSNEAKRG